MFREVAKSAELKARQVVRRMPSSRMITGAFAVSTAIAVAAGLTVLVGYDIRLAVIVLQLVSYAIWGTTCVLQHRLIEHAKVKARALEGENRTLKEQIRVLRGEPYRRGLPPSRD